MSSCNYAGPDGTEIMIKRIESMISENYTALFILFVAVAIISIFLYYFVMALMKTLREYRFSKKDINNTSGDNPINPIDDNYQYDSSSFIEPVEYLPTGTKTHIKNMDKVYSEYNQLKSDYISKTYNKENDDLIDYNVLFASKDKYKYNDYS